MNHFRELLLPGIIQTVRQELPANRVVRVLRDTAKDAVIFSFGRQSTTLSWQEVLTLVKSEDYAGIAALCRQVAKELLREES